jgi:hypothetical protein
VLIGFPFGELQTSDLQSGHDAWIHPDVNSPGVLFISTERTSMWFAAQTKQQPPAGHAVCQVFT